MMFLESIAEAVLDRSPEELIGALLCAAVVAVFVAGFYALGRRKSVPSPSLVGGLALGAGVVCMTLAAGYLRYMETEGRPRRGNSAPAPGWPPGGPGRVAAMPPWGHYYGMAWSSGFHIVVAADADHDGRLTSEEAAQLIHKADRGGSGSVNFQEIDRFLMRRFQPSDRDSTEVDTPEPPANQTRPPVNTHE